MKQQTVQRLHLSTMHCRVYCNALKKPNWHFQFTICYVWQNWSSWSHHLERLPNWKTLLIKAKNIHQSLRFALHMSTNIQEKQETWFTLVAVRMSFACGCSCSWHSRTKSFRDIDADCARDESCSPCMRTGNTQPIISGCSLSHSENAPIVEKAKFLKCEHPTESKLK